ncbi:MAG: hypothetical protein RBR35_07455 [Salinivirgaceae bacterium]|nr:hypothetical protein [Salinivirgaceae bacterium]
MSHNYKVLLIDRDDTSRSLIGDLIGVRYKNIRVLSYKKAERALETLEKENVDIVLAEIGIFMEQAQNISGINDRLIKTLKDIPCVTITPKISNDKIGKEVNMVAIDNLDKPFKPASLYLILDKHLLSSEERNEQEKEFVVPNWARFQYIDIRVLCQTYSCEKEKVVKILKLYPPYVQTQIESLKLLFEAQEMEQLYESFQTLRTSFLYFSKPEVMKIFDSIFEHIEKSDLDSGHNLFLLLKGKWAEMSKEISII